MSSFGGRKRAPFGEAPADIDNRGVVDSTIVGKRKLEPPAPSAVFHRGGSVSSILSKHGVGSKSSRARPRPGAPPLPSSPQRSKLAASDAHGGGPETRARVYKAEAYEAKIRAATQEQRIEALEAELEELRFFQSVEREGNGVAADREILVKKSKDDAELIEALAQECETMERDLKASQSRVEELSAELDDSKLRRSRSEDHATQASQNSGWEAREAELKAQIERQEKEVANAKQDVMQGLAIVRELDGALRKCRKEKDDVKSQLHVLQTEKAKEEGNAESLQAMQDERDGALAKVKQLKQGIREREEGLAKWYEQQTSEVQGMKSTIAELTEQVEEQKREISAKAGAIESMKDAHASQVAHLKREYAADIERMSAKKSDNEHLKREHAAEIERMSEKESDLVAQCAKERNVQEDLRRELTIAQAKIDSFKAIETKCIADATALNDSLNESVDDVDELPLDELQMENARLKAERDDLLRKLQLGLDIHKKTTQELEEKTSELHELETDAEGTQNQLAKAVDIIKSMEKKQKASDERFKSEVASLQSEARESEGTISALKEEQSSKASRTMKLQRDLASAQKENEECQLKIQTLEEAVQNMKMALKTASNGKLSPRRTTPSPVGYDERRRQIEEHALKEYCAQRID
ncbi:hypothetical protein ACHAXT_000654 [Thalassiosira profunda]